jgi:hypothetical protein
MLPVRSVMLQVIAVLLIVRQVNRFLVSWAYDRHGPMMSVEIASSSICDKPVNAIVCIDCFDCLIVLPRIGLIICYSLAIRSISQIEPVVFQFVNVWMVWWRCCLPQRLQKAECSSSHNGPGCPRTLCRSWTHLTISDHLSFRISDQRSYLMN